MFNPHPSHDLKLDFLRAKNMKTNATNKQEGPLRP